MGPWASQGPMGLGFLVWPQKTETECEYLGGGRRPPKSGSRGGGPLGVWSPVGATLRPSRASKILYKKFQL